MNGIYQSAKNHLIIIYYFNIEYVYNLIINYMTHAYFVLF